MTTSSARLAGQKQIVRDFDAANNFAWVPWTVEGTYVVQVVVRDITPYRTYRYRDLYTPPLP